jgi:uncharacterized protein (TIGR03083 family)
MAESVAMEIATHIDALEVHGRRLAEAADKAGLDAPVPTCPRWRVRDLLRHQGGVHRWAAGNISRGRMSDEETRAAFDAPDDGGLLEWFGDGHRQLVETLRATDPATEAFTFLPAPSALAFWSRRQAHETAIHRVDAESASGDLTPFDPAFAADGLSELIEGFMGRRGGRLYADPPVSLAVEATDVDAAWTVRVGPEDRVVEPGARAADATVRGTASDLYVLLWNRTGTERVSVEGDRAVLDIWRERAQIRWR